MASKLRLSPLDISTHRRKDLIMRSAKKVIAAGVTALAIVALSKISLASPAVGLDPLRPWGEFQFGGVDSFASAGNPNVFSDGNNDFDLGDPPWTFTGSGFLIV
ncbi:MAG: hypothetical protein FJ143_07845, partial [Deltaproteobacteria bacterium]|nr:hypothetical protein [Deltaproteobacteria bacterium]